ncbi:MAG TPA: hypothetical protein VLS89_19420 [Candidatus Nanopelagicales bacterium]|nr:hypothetical protein [Candidatus Nanopelagicales bacterium]
MAKSKGQGKRPRDTRDDARDDARDAARDDARGDAEQDRDEGEEQGAPDEEEAGEHAADAAEEDGKQAEDEAPRKDKPRGKAPKRPAARPVPPPPPPVPPGALGKSLLLFVLIVGGLAAAFALLGQETGGSVAAANWKPGAKPQVEITLIANDRRELSCWSAEELNGRHCGFEGPTKPWSKGDPADDKTLLRPYTTVDRIQFLAAGLWTEPALSGSNLPLGRFSVKCTYNVEGVIKRPGIRWSSEGAWLDQTNDWHTGYVSNCKVLGAN